MRIDDSGDYRSISLLDEYGKVNNEMLLIIQKSGFGKSLARESIAEELHNLGYVVISLTDVKDEFESCYAMFRPTEKYHLDGLKKCGKKPTEKKVKIYHPFSFDIPKKLLPKIDFFTIPIKSLNKYLISFLAETDAETDSVKLIIDAIRDIYKKDSIYDLLHKIRGNIQTSQKKYYGKTISSPGKDSLFLDIAQKGKKTEISQIFSWFRPFLRHYFLAPENFRINLDVMKIINDQEHYHCLSTKWINKLDDKIKYFTIMAFMSEIFRYKDYFKHPICFIIEEIAFLAPFKAEGFKGYLASFLRENLLSMRSEGMGCFSIMTSQIWSDVDEKLREKSTQTLIGNVQGIMDIDRISKVFKLRKDDLDTLISLKRNQYILQGDNDFQPFDIFLPSHCHAEERYNFIEMYSRNGFPMVKYDPLINEVKEHLNNIEKEYHDKAENDRKRKISEAKEEYERSLAKDRAVKELEDLKQKVRNKADNSREEIIRKCKELKRDNPEITVRDIADKLGISAMTVTRYLRAYPVTPNT